MDASRSVSPTIEFLDEPSVHKFPGNRSDLLPLRFALLFAVSSRNACKCVFNMRCYWRYEIIFRAYAKRNPATPFAETLAE